MGSSAYFEVYITYKYGDLQEVSRISLHEISISINSIGQTKGCSQGKERNLHISPSLLVALEWNQRWSLGLNLCTRKCFFWWCSWEIEDRCQFIIENYQSDTLPKNRPSKKVFYHILFFFWAKKNFFRHVWVYISTPV